MSWKTILLIVVGTIVLYEAGGVVSDPVAFWDGLSTTGKICFVTLTSIYGLSQFPLLEVWGRKVVRLEKATRDTGEHPTVKQVILADMADGVVIGRMLFAAYSWPALLVLGGLLTAANFFNRRKG